MAKYNILSINKMSSGDKRGLLDMTIAFDYKLLQKLLLLDKISLSSNEDGEVVEIEDEAIATETGDYDYARTEFISDFKPIGHKNPLAKEENHNQLILDETQIQIDASSMSACHHHPANCKYHEEGDTLLASDEHYAIQLTPEYWLSSKVDLSALHEFNTRVSKMHVVFEFEKDDIQNQTVMHIENSTSQQLFPMNDMAIYLET